VLVVRAGLVRVPTKQEYRHALPSHFESLRQLLVEPLVK
jgi:hypothetical protein